MITYTDVAFDKVVEPLAGLLAAEFRKLAPVAVESKVPDRSEQWFELVYDGSSLVQDFAHATEREHRVTVRYWRKAAGEQGLKGLNRVTEMVERCARLLWNNRVNATTGWYAGSVAEIDYEPAVEPEMKDAGYRAVDLAWSCRYNEAIS